MNVEAEVQLRVRGIYGVCFGNTNSPPCAWNVCIIAIEPQALTSPSPMQAVLVERTKNKNARKPAVSKPKRKGGEAKVSPTRVRTPGRARAARWTCEHEPAFMRGERLRDPINRIQTAQKTHAPSTV